MHTADNTDGIKSREADKFPRPDQFYRYTVLGEYYSRCKNLALYIRDCESLCLSDETVKAVGPFYLVSMPGEVKYPTQGVNV